MSADAQSSPAHGHGLHVVIPASSAPAADEHTPAPAAHAQTPLAQSAGGAFGHPHELMRTPGHPHEFSTLGQPTPGHPHEFQLFQELNQQPTGGHPHEFLRELGQTPTDGHGHELFALLFHGRAEAGSPTRPRPSPRVMRRSSLFTEQEDETQGPAAAHSPMLPATMEEVGKGEEGSSQESVSQVEDEQRA